MPLMVYASEWWEEPGGLALRGEIGCRGTGIEGFGCQT